MTGAVARLDGQSPCPVRRARIDRSGLRRTARLLAACWCTRVEIVTSPRGGTAPATCFRGYTHPSCCIVTPSFQIFVIWRILSPSKAMS